MQWVFVINSNVFHCSSNASKGKLFHSIKLIGGLWKHHVHFDNHSILQLVLNPQIKLKILKSNPESIWTSICTNKTIQFNLYTKTVNSKELLERCLSRITTDRASRDLSWPHWPSSLFYYSLCFEAVFCLLKTLTLCFLISYFFFPFSIKLLQFFHFLHTTCLLLILFTMFSNCGFLLMPQTELLKKKTLHVTDIPLTIYTCRLLQQHDAVGLQSGLWVVNSCPFRQIFYQFFSKKSLCSFFCCCLFFFNHCLNIRRHLSVLR